MKNKFKTMKRLMVIGFLFPLIINGQPEIPGEGEIYIDDIVPRIDIFIDPDTLDLIYENPGNKTEHLALFIFDNGNILDTVENIGFRIRGNTSIDAAKKSFKISFNTFEQGRKWEGVEKLNLNGEHNDPSIIRSKLCWDLMRKMEVPASRSNHIEVYINNNHYGLYINVEHIDETFVEARFGNNNGNLYKCLYPADLNYLGPNPESYKITMNNRRIYDLKTNKQEDDYSDLAHFIDVLNNTPDDEFLCEIEKVFNVYDYLKVIAVEIFTGHWDNYIYLNNNYYLYSNKETGKFEYIPYDMDNTLGIDWIGRDWADRDIYDWQQHGSNVRPLYTRLMENEELKDKFSYYLNYLIEEFTDVPSFIAEIEMIKSMITPYVENDPYYPLDYGFTINDFHNSFTEDLGGHVAYGLYPYIETRNETAQVQLELNNISPVIKYINNNQLVPEEDLWVRAYIEDEDIGPEVVLLYSFNEADWHSVFMYDDGDHNDSESGDKVYGGLVSLIPNNSIIKYKVSAKDNFGYTSVMPCEPVVISLEPSQEPKLFINEFMASNDSTITDEFGEYDDWIEIYNGDDKAVWLGDKYLTDDFDNTDKWLMPDITLGPGEFVLFWADNQPNQGNKHTNFKLNKGGEVIGINDAPGTGFFSIDSITYGPQSTDTSFGRIDDGGHIWKFYENSTPGYSNIVDYIFESSSSQDQIYIYPNPNLDGLLFLNEKNTVYIFNSLGKLILYKINTSVIDVSYFDKGMYIIKNEAGHFAKIIIN